MRHLLSSLALVLLAATGAHGQSPEAAIKRRGFEFRPNQEVSWGVKLEAPQRLVWVEANGAKYKIDPGVPIALDHVRQFIQAYLQKHAQQEVALIAELFLGSPPTVEVTLGSASIASSSTVLEQAPVVQYRATFLSATVAKKPKDVHCRFMFIVHKGATFLVYSKLTPGSNKEHDVEPHCDL